MEQNPFSPRQPEVNPEDDKEKKRKKKRDGLKVPLPVDKNGNISKEEAKKDEPTALDQLLAKLTVRQEAPEAEEAAETAPEFDAAAEEAETYEPFPTPELSSLELNGGEVIIDLHSGTPVVTEVLAPDPVERPVPVTLAQSEAATATAMPEAAPAPVSIEQPLVAPPEILPPVAGMPEAAPALQPTVEHAVPTAERPVRQAERRGLLTGLLVGGGFEHWRHARRERQQARKQERRVRAVEQVQQVESSRLAEQEQQHVKHEQRIAQLEGQAEQPLQVPKEHRLEQSAWHVVEVDKKTGKAVETPTFQYGHEFYKERAAETLPTHHRNAAAGEVALVAAAAADDNTVTQVTQNTPVNTPGQRIGTAGATKVSVTKGPNGGAPVIWPWVTVLVLVVICLLIVVR